MATQKHMGRGKLIERLTAQTGSRGMAIGLLKKRGHLSADGRLTPKGRERDQMTASERAKDRAAKDRGGKATDYRYNPRTNVARRK